MCSALPQNAADQQGFTLAEFVVVMVVLSIVGSAAAGLYLYSVKWIKNWQTNIAIENSAHLLMNQVVSDLQYAEKVISLSDSSWVIKGKGTKETHYLMADSSLYRNGRSAVDGAVNVLGFLIRADSLFSLDPPEILTPKRMMTVQIHIEIPPVSFLLSTKTGIRQPEPWPLYVLRVDTTGVIN